MPGQGAALRAEDVVVATERHDLEVARGPGHLGETVGVEPAAGHQEPGGDDVLPGRPQEDPVALASDRGDLVAGQDLATGRGHDVGVGSGNPAPVDDARLGRVEGLDADHVWLELAEPLRADHLEPGYAVGGATPIELLEAG